MATAEPFPILNSPMDPLHRAAGENGSVVNAVRRRRKSSGLGSDLRVGDTGAPSLATSLAHLNGAHGGSHIKSDGKEKRFSKRRKARSLARRVKQFAVKHTWVLPLAILLVFASLYAVNPSESNPMHRFIFLSYKQPGDSGEYGKGLWDIAFVAFYTVVLSFTRELIMQELLRPLARYCGLRNRGKQARFMEQMYTALYFAILGPVGMYVMSRTPVWYFNTRGFYEAYPHKTLDPFFKFYYLFQAAYWAQQAIVLLLGMEKPRKDFKELVGHHIVSLTLIALSYRFHFTHIGLAVYITHDISDFFLATSKCLSYIDGPFMGPYFAMFMLVWIYMRHYLNLRIIYSLFTEFKTVGPYEIDWIGGQYKCPLAFYITLSLLASLQSLNLFWLFFIVRIAYRFVVKGHAEDDRSDNEEDTEVEEKEAAMEKQPLLANGNGRANGYAHGNAGAASHGEERVPLQEVNGNRGANGKAKANGHAKKR